MSDLRVRVVGLAIAAVTITAAFVTGCPRVPSRDRTQCCVDSTLLSLQLAPSAKDAQMVLVTDEAARLDRWSNNDIEADVLAAIKDNLRDDRCYFAPAYTVLFMYFGWLIQRRDKRRILSAMAIGLALLTFVADEAENFSALSMLGGDGPAQLERIDSAAVTRTRGLSLAKWFLAGLTSLALAALFWPRKHWPADVELISFAAAALLLAGGAFAIWGTTATAFNPGIDSSIESSFTATSLAFLPAIALLAAYPVWLRPPGDPLVVHTD